MRPLVSGAFLALALPVTTPLGAQQPATPRSVARTAPVVILGTVSTPARRAAVGVIVGLGFGPRDTTDARGRFRLVLGTSGTSDILVVCRSATYLHARRLGSMAVNLTRPDTLRLSLTVDPALCTEPAVDTLTSDFRGHWSVGFEQSEFVLCPSSVPPGHGVRQPRLSRIWADLLSGTPLGDSTAVPDSSGDGHRYYVHVRGRLHGPGDFGHLGIAAYQLDVTDVLEIRTPAEHDCLDRPPPVHLRWSDSVVTVSAPTLMVVRGPEESAELALRAHRVGPAMGWVVVERGYDAAWMVTTDGMTVVGPFHPRRLGYTLLTPGSRPQWLLDGEVNSDAVLAAALAKYSAAAGGAPHGGGSPER